MLVLQHITHPDGRFVHDMYVCTYVYLPLCTVQAVLNCYVRFRVDDGDEFEFGMAHSKDGALDNLTYLVHRFQPALMFNLEVHAPTEQDNANCYV